MNEVEALKTIISCPNCRYCKQALLYNDRFFCWRTSDIMEVECVYRCENFHFNDNLQSLRVKDLNSQL